jgi:hypothetical protein
VKELKGDVMNSERYQLQKECIVMLEHSCLQSSRPHAVHGRGVFGLGPYPNMVSAINQPRPECCVLFCFASRVQV